MIREIYDQLSVPKTVNELYERLNEIGLKWNKSQVELFLQMDNSIICSGEIYSIKESNNRDFILDIIDKTIGEKPILPIKKVMENVPVDVVVSSEEILKIAIDSGRYISPNGAVLKKVN